jgi:hypothetical protein
VWFAGAAPGKRFRSPFLGDVAGPPLRLSAPGSSVFPPVASGSEAAREVCADPAAASAVISAAAVASLTKAFIFVSMPGMGFIFFVGTRTISDRIASYILRYPGLSENVRGSRR